MLMAIKVSVLTLLEHKQIFLAHPKYEGYPAKHITLRSIDESHWRIIDVSTNQDVEDIEADRAYFTLYQGSIFLHQGNSYYVFEVNDVQKYAKGMAIYVW